MQHESIIRTLETLIPEGVKHGPEPVLLKYASDNNLAPAQLERMAQMYNVAMTLNFMDKSANRGGSFEIIDIPNLLQKFTDPYEDKAASIPDDWKGWFETGSVKSASVGEILESAPDFMTAARGGSLYKSAFELPEDEGPLYESAVSPGFRQMLHKESQFRFEMDSLDRLEFESEEKFRKAAEALHDLLRTNYDADFNEMRDDAVALNGEGSGVLKAASAVEEYIAQKGFKIVHKDYTRPYIVRDRHNTSELFKQASEALDMLSATRAYRSEMEKEATASADDLEVGDTVMASDRNNYGKVININGDNIEVLFKSDEGNTANVTLRRSQLTKQPRSGRAQGGGNAPGSFGTGSNQQGRRTNNAPIDNNTTGAGGPGAQRPGGSLPKVTVRPLGGGSSSKDQQLSKKEKTDAIMSLIGDTLQSGKELADINTYTGGADFDTHLNTIKKLGPGYNKTQKTIDEGVDDAAHMATMQRLMLTDPIISKADPDMVVSLANTLASASPQVRKDPNLLRMALREAIQYEAIPLHTFKDLVDIEDKTQKAISGNRDNTKARYNI